MKTVTQVFAGIFGVLAVIFYFSSIQQVNTGYGSIQVANIQATVFAAACAVMCVVNIVGIFILSYIEDLNSSLNGAIKAELRNVSSDTKSENGTSTISSPSVSNNRSSLWSERKTEGGNQWRCKKCSTWNSSNAQYCKDCGQYK